MPKRLPILIVEDEPAHRLMIRKALEHNGISDAIHEVVDGADALDYVYGRGEYADRHSYPLPSLILLDIKMPRMDGIEVLTTLKSNRETMHIPIVVLTTSETASDIQRCYKLGANAYFVKPVTREALWEKMKVLKEFWLGAAEIPAPHAAQTAGAPA